MFRVFNHNTGLTAKVVLVKDLYSIANQYINEIRPVSPPAVVFLMLNGTAMDSSTMSNDMSIELSHSSVSTHVTCTKLGHVGVSVVHATRPGEDRLPLINLFAHSPQLAADSSKSSSNMRSSNKVGILIRQQLTPIDLGKPSCKLWSILFVTVFFDKFLYWQGCQLLTNFYIDKSVLHKMG